ncbi:carboxylating nicotinate-nucleotide diphosphorylase [Lentilactobacillus kefiri]|uniref:nicotinate-nucleotide diphosphorylase (carboxylating) n=2 Tax=Lentilactobacillus kefiri TaxID=33962 RepID=A0A8E1UZI9_LENKE|nr:carboxylating nicotinate-nucleotide diphosphorylase [Lentilactobacillus kefiri]KRL73644.1 nicotinate-nucleotide pyrophosphorylase [Lentilactobacillus parakefiri DSM 10551]KRM49747.1 nicotinate-nucleotide pyrophosphorylase [Lentilactobacillus kefiri DSM 20587 = JCM 5818]MCJ2161611.1 carboxylating nicotinate-nucleotide diphosphorylase [Lentilactobacillus kefiri]MCP9368200.1 carboxylating nicotinate-nucleotide diphosphorylase [Lentilactobacillus kefiri]MDH5109657.1 carboxylating nicotinate-nuc
MNNILLAEKLKEFLNEDLNFGDMSLKYLQSSKVISGSFIAKQAGVVCGQEIPQAAYDLLGNAHYTALVEDGKYVSNGTIIGKATGQASVLLTGERVILNLVQRMSGIASKTARIIAKLDDPTIKITDTRKTAPGLRMFDKFAVAAGGGFNHRFDLTGGIMLKDNHIALAGGVREALLAVKRNVGPLTPIEIEVETEDELKDAASVGANVIMFDNQKPETIKEWKRLVPETMKIEASGGITEETVASFKGCGADYLSIGNLTNDVSPLDISFLVKGVIKK